MKKYLSTFLISLILLFGQTVFAALSASQTVSATLTRTTPPGPGPGPSPGPVIPGGAIVGIAAGGAASGASALAFAPLLLAGLTPDGVVCAAAPIDCIPCVENLLQCAIMHNFCTNDLNCALSKMKSSGKFYIAQNNESLRNGSFDMQPFVLPPEILNAQKVRINVTLAADSSFKEVNGTPELALGIYKDISQKDLDKKFETQQFLHHYLMKKYEVPLKITDRSYNCGIQKLTGILDLKDIGCKKMPLKTVVRFTENGFQRSQAKINPKVKYYAYLMEFEKIR